MFRLGCFSYCQLVWPSSSVFSLFNVGLLLPALLLVSKCTFEILLLFGVYVSYMRLKKFFEFKAELPNSRRDLEAHAIATGGKTECILQEDIRCTKHRKLDPYIMKNVCGCSDQLKANVDMVEMLETADCPQTLDVKVSSVLLNYHAVNGRQDAGGGDMPEMVSEGNKPVMKNDIDEREICSAEVICSDDAGIDEIPVDLSFNSKSDEMNGERVFTYADEAVTGRTGKEWNDRGFFDSRSNAEIHAEECLCTDDSSDVYDRLVGDSFAGDTNGDGISSCMEIMTTPEADRDSTYSSEVPSQAVSPHENTPQGSYWESIIRAQEVETSSPGHSRLRGIVCTNPASGFSRLRGCMKIVRRERSPSLHCLAGHGDFDHRSGNDSCARTTVDTDCSCQADTSETFHRDRDSCRSHRAAICNIRNSSVYDQVSGDFAPTGDLDYSKQESSGENYPAKHTDDNDDSDSDYHEDYMESGKGSEGDGKILLTFGSKHSKQSGRARGELLSMEDTLKRLKRDLHELEKGTFRTAVVKRLHTVVASKLAGSGRPLRSRSERMDDSKIRRLKSRYSMSEFYLTSYIRPPSPVVPVYMLTSGSQQTPVLAYAGYENEMRRLATFARLQPPPGIYILRVASAGFFCPNGVSESLDRVGSNGTSTSSSFSDTDLVCAFCGVVVSVLQFVGRQAMDVHKEVSPRCPLVLGEDRRNVSVGDLAQASGMQYLSTLPSYSGGAPPTGSGSAGGQSVLATDCEGNTAPSALQAFPGFGKDGAAAKPALLLPPVGQQLLTVAHAATSTGGQINPTEQRLPRPEPQSDSRLGQTVANARRADSASQSATLQTPALPRQTATVAPASSATQNQANTGAQSSSGTSESSSNLAQTSSSPQRDSASSRQNGSGQGEATQERQVVTYEQLGIFAQRPKRQDMAVTATRINSFEHWPHRDSHPPERMAEAGFYFTGHADLVRCFYCKGGLKTWERTDQPWIEHSRWFPKCPFVRMCKGQKFVDAIQKLNEAGGRPTITEADLKREIQRREEEERRNRPASLLPPPPAASASLQTDCAEGAVGGTTALRHDLAVGDGNDPQALARRLEEENQEMKETTMCKMCQSREVNVLFLPCGHLVACAYCAPALRTCAMCRQPVKGSVRVQLDEEESPDI